MHRRQCRRFRVTVQHLTTELIGYTITLVIGHSRGSVAGNMDVYIQARTDAKGDIDIDAAQNW